MDKGFMVSLRRDRVRNEAFPLKGLTLRIVFDYDSLVEKIRILDADLSDFTIEVIKYYCWEKTTGKKPSEFRWDEIRFVCRGKVNNVDSLVFGCKTSDGPQTIGFPYSKYASSASEMCSESSKLFPKGKWHVIDDSLRQHR